ncbi:unnamed protein product [Amoebophrya sp. A120]|nr:unnamed protein product [Amoebophrya sp. A120]|eukprot:GSA120T00015088001.1
MSQRQIHPATGSQSMAPRKSMVATPLTNFGSIGGRRNSKDNLGVIPSFITDQDQSWQRASSASAKGGDLFPAGEGSPARDSSLKRNSRESQQEQAAVSPARSHRRSSTIESSTGEQLIVAPEEETYEMRGLLINVCISVLLGVLIGVCGAMFHNAVHLMKVFFRVVLGSAMVDAFDYGPYIFIHMWLGATACSMVVSFITRHMCPECIGGGMVATKICICLSSPIQLQIIAYRFVLSAIYIGGGSPLGIEAPTFHLSAALASNANKFIERLDNTILNADTMPQIVLIGCVAGLSQAFNTPIGSLLFVLEEFDFVRRSHITFVMIVACSVPATAVSLYLKKAFDLHSSFLALPPPENLASDDVSLLLLYLYAGLIGAITSMFSELFSTLVLRFRSRFATFVSSFEVEGEDESDHRVGEEEMSSFPTTTNNSDPKSTKANQDRRLSLDSDDMLGKSDSGCSGFPPSSSDPPGSEPRTVNRFSGVSNMTPPPNAFGGNNSVSAASSPGAGGQTAGAAPAGPTSAVVVPGMVNNAGVLTSGPVPGGGGGQGAGATPSGSSNKQDVSTSSSHVEPDKDNSSSSNADGVGNGAGGSCINHVFAMNNQVVVVPTSTGPQPAHQMNNASAAGAGGPIIIPTVHRNPSGNASSIDPDAFNQGSGGAASLSSLSASTSAGKTTSKSKPGQAAGSQISTVSPTAAAQGGRMTMTNFNQNNPNAPYGGGAAAQISGQALVTSITGLKRRFFSFEKIKLKRTERGYFLLNVLAGSVVGVCGIIVYNVSRSQANIACNQWKKECPDSWGTGEQLLEYLHRKAHQAANRNDGGVVRRMSRRGTNAQTVLEEQGVVVEEERAAQLRQLRAGTPSSRIFPEQTRRRSRNRPPIRSYSATSTSSTSAQHGENRDRPSRGLQATGRAELPSYFSPSEAEIQREPLGAAPASARPLSGSRPSAQEESNFFPRAEDFQGTGRAHSLHEGTSWASIGRKLMQTSGETRETAPRASIVENDQLQPRKQKTTSPKNLLHRSSRLLSKGPADASFSSADVGKKVDIGIEEDDEVGTEQHHIFASDSFRTSSSSIYPSAPPRFRERSQNPPHLLRDGDVEQEKRLMMYSRYHHDSRRGLLTSPEDEEQEALFSSSTPEYFYEQHDHLEPLQQLRASPQRQLGSSTFVDYGDIPISSMALTYFVVGFLKMIAVAVCTAAGGSGGMFAPAMIMGGYFGGGLGSLLKWISDETDPVNGTYLQLCVLFGMVGFFSASHRLPLTGSLCIYELIVASTDEDKTIAGSFIVSRLFFPMLVCSIVSFCLSIYMHPQALLERTMEQDGLHDLCFGPAADSDDDSSEEDDDDDDETDSDSESTSEEKTLDKDKDGGSAESNGKNGSVAGDQASIMSLVSKTLLPPELMVAGKSRRQSVDLGQVFRKPLYETGSFVTSSATHNMQKDGKRHSLKKPKKSNHSSSSPNAEQSAPSAEDGSSQQTGTNSRNSRNMEDPVTGMDPGSMISQHALAQAQAEKDRLKIRRASHPPTASAVNTNARIVEFYQRNSQDLRKEFEALRQATATPSSSTSKRSFVPLQILQQRRPSAPDASSISARRADSKEAPDRIQNVIRSGGGTGDAGGDSPPLVHRELSIGAGSEDVFRARLASAAGSNLSSDYNTSTEGNLSGVTGTSSMLISRGGILPAGSPSVCAVTTSASSQSAGMAGAGAGAANAAANSKRATKRNTKVSSTSTLRILENAMKRRGNAADTASSLSSMGSSAESNALGQGAAMVVGSGGPGTLGSNVPRPSAMIGRGRSGSISTTPGQLWKDLRESRAERDRSVHLAATLEEESNVNSWEMLSNLGTNLSQRSIVGGPKHSMSMVSIGSNAPLGIHPEIVYPSAVPEEDEKESK